MKKNIVLKFQKIIIIIFKIAIICHFAELIAGNCRNYTFYITIRSKLKIQNINSIFLLESLNFVSMNDLFCMFILPKSLKLILPE